MATRIQFRRSLSGEWTAGNPVLAQGELAIELDTSRFKIGDGIEAWNDLPYGGIDGEQGEQGIQGEQGDQGIQGVKGDTGSQGIRVLQAQQAQTEPLVLSGKGLGITLLTM